MQCNHCLVEQQQQQDILLHSSLHEMHNDRHWLADRNKIAIYAHTCGCIRLAAIAKQALLAEQAMCNTRLHAPNDTASG